MYAQEQAKFRDSQRRIGKFYAELEQFNAKKVSSQVEEDE